MTKTTRVRLAAAAALAVAGGAIAYLALGGIEQNLVYYWTPADLLAKSATVQDATIRLGGMVQVGSKQWDPDSLLLRFTMGQQLEPGGPSVALMCVPWARSAADGNSAGLSGFAWGSCSAGEGKITSPGPRSSRQ